MKKKVMSKDGVEYTIDISERVIKLTEDQLTSIKNEIQSLESTCIEDESGINLYNIPSHQRNEVINHINRILNGLTVNEIIDQEFLDFTTHASQRINDKKICIDRRWTPGNVKHEIVECLKRAYSVEQIRVKFNSDTKRSWKQLVFRIKGSIGVKNNRRDGEVVIHFDEDPIDGELIVIVTILKPKY